MSTSIPANQLLGQLRWRYATKQFDPTRKISASDWNALEEALLLSPSSGGLQPWGFFVINDPATREKLLGASFGQTKVVEASHLVVFAARTTCEVADVDAHIARTAEVRGVPVESMKEFREMLVGGIVNSMDAPARLAWAGRQVGIALGNLLTSAALLGIDACPMEGFLPAEYDAILGLKEKGYTSLALCTLGYRAASDTYATLAKVRFPKDKVIFHV
jgi:nitroreductase